MFDSSFGHYGHQMDYRPHPDHDSFGCAASYTAINKKDLKVDTRTSTAIFVGSGTP